MKRILEGKYYYVGDLYETGTAAHITTDQNQPSDAGRWQKGNYFETKEEAEAIVERIKRIRSGSLKAFAVWHVTNPNFAEPSVTKYRMVGYETQEEAVRVKNAINKLFKPNTPKE